MISMHKKMTRSRAIRAKCLDCCADQQGEVSSCRIVSCPLWPYRDGKTPSIDDLCGTQELIAETYGLVPPEPQEWHKPKGDTNE